MYYLYHIPGVKIGVTTNLKERVECQQGYNPDEYEVLAVSRNIDYISNREIEMQKAFGYRVDRQLYKDLHNNNFKQLNNMNINVTEMTTTFPCPVNKLKGQLRDNLNMSWETEFGSCIITEKSIEWIMDNVKSSQYTQERCYIYNKAFARWFDNHDVWSYKSHDKLGGNLKDVHMRNELDNAKQMNDQYNGRTRSGALSPVGVRQEICKHKSYQECDCGNIPPFTTFDNIRQWAFERGLYDKGDPKTQTLKLMEEAGEICRAVLKKDQPEIIDGIGDCVVVLTNLAHLCDTSIEECIEAAYNEIKGRSGRMINGTFKKD